MFQGCEISYKERKPDFTVLVVNFSWHGTP